MKTRNRVTMQLLRGGPSKIMSNPERSLRPPHPQDQDRCVTIGRGKINNEDKVRPIVQDVELRRSPSEDLSCLRKSGTLYFGRLKRDFHYVQEVTLYFVAFLVCRSEDRNMFYMLTTSELVVQKFSLKNNVRGTETI